ncbi:DUF1205 domain-containing protein [Streptomyces sp. H27-C3]|nr:nucleotide disphospho-sugar-binding domain-containing protein [Streptomyces sp. H27-C3]MDJ0466243.1 DUF1205 domain-containing protein [Streptomyces sp. H27-C3]
MSGHIGKAAEAGLPVVDVSPGVDYDKLQYEFAANHPRLLLKPRSLQEDDADDFQFDAIAELFAEVSAPTVDNTVELARRWRPDVILYTPCHGTGPLVAAVLGIPAVMHGFNVILGSEMTAAIARQMAPHFERYGIDPSAVRPDVILDVAPPTLRRTYNDYDTVWPIRYLPYNGGGVLPAWLSEPRTRPRVTATLGSTVPGASGISPLGTLIQAAGTIDADFVLALGGADLTSLGTLPPNVTPVDWIPFNELLAVSDAIIHHGGGGTTLTTFAAGIPQYVLPHGADNYVNAKLVRTHGIGDGLMPDQLTSERLNHLISYQPIHDKAASIANEIRSQEPFAARIPQLVDLAG